MTFQITGGNEVLFPAAFRMDEAYFKSPVIESRMFTQMISNGTWKLDSFSIAACRELLINSRNAKPESLTKYFWPLAKRYDGQDIFYRAALNIALGTDPERRDKILADFEKHFPNIDNTTLDLVWELKPKAFISKLDGKLFDREMLSDPKRRLMDIIASSDDVADGLKLFNYYKHPDSDVFDRRHAFTLIKERMGNKWAKLKEEKAVVDFIQTSLKPALPRQDVVRHMENRRNAIEFAAGIQDAAISYAIRSIAEDPQDRDQGLAIFTLGSMKSAASVRVLEKLASTETLAGGFAIQSLSKMNTPESTAVLKNLIESSSRSSVQTEAMKGLAGTREGSDWLLKKKEDGKLPEALVAETGRILRNSPFQAQRNKAMLLFPPPGKLDPKKLPPITELAKRTGDAARGKLIMAKSLNSEVQCMKCHTVRGQGGQIGPDLSMIGKKGSRDNIIESILYPSKAIADQYLTWKLDTEDGQSISGLIMQETETTITLRDANGKDYNVPVKGTEKKKLLTSIMPEGLIGTLTEDELIDLVEYLMSLRTASLTPDYWHLAGPFPAADDKALDTEYGPEKGAFNIGAKFKSGNKEVTWRHFKPTTGYFDLAAFHGSEAVNSLSYMTRTIESPVDQDATILLGVDDGCRVYVNGEKVFGHERHEAATPERDSIPVKLKKGTNTIMLKVSNGNNPHGFYFAISSGVELKLSK